MPYNTRRKSLSLPSLGIHLPTGSRAANRSPPTTSAMSPPETTQQPPPAKKVKRSHTSASTSPTPTSPSRPSAIRFRDDEPKSASRMAENTPPPSPGEHGVTKIDTQGIDDEIVVAVIEQLEKTGNRPHLLKELAAVLSTQLAIVESSANQSAIISSRLTTYLRRPWSALSPCPVGKELIGTHPKRIFFYLSTCPHQPFPDPDTLNAQQAQQRSATRIISPSLSSASGSANGEDEQEQADRNARSREQMSPSPELDLDLDLTSANLDSIDLDMSNDIDMDADPDVASLSRTYSGRGSLSRDGTHPPTDSNMSHNRRAVSPPLEGDEREFTQTASELQMLVMRKRAEEKEERERRASRELSLASGSASGTNSAGGPATPNSAGASDTDDADIKMESASNPDDEDDGPVIVDESEETCALRNHEAAAALFGGSGVDVDMLNIASPMLTGKVHFASSPLVKPTMNVSITSDKVPEKGLKWSELELRSPETVDLNELDDLFDSF
ncbi:hypothetical protein NA57DRAFT_77738 [Rhizodiscina lignyota]|uniref:GDS1 winged helix domain-containing protein n=1 Tax=Rhizodiscina lignyota TaxID=1504668 RepID=A0A9P4M491_9PEZI|nr:hypothetical protein NA57DRAFT_77738 [Rhizodiscina lignyota]